MTDPGHEGTDPVVEVQPDPRLRWPVRCQMTVRTGDDGRLAIGAAVRPDLSDEDRLDGQQWVNGRVARLRADGPDALQWLTNDADGCRYAMLLPGGTQWPGS